MSSCHVNSGTSISVFGILANTSSGGNISATYTVDGISKTLGIPKGTLDMLPMVQLFHSDLQAGSHTLVVNVTDIAAPRALGIDFITYNASFDSLSSSLPAGASNQKKLGLRVGAAIGAISCVLLLCALVAYLWRRRQLKQRRGVKLSDL